MKKTLVIVAHPHIDQSVINKRWVEELEKYPDQFTVHQIYQAYPDGVIDVAKEQALVEEHENLVFQFPVYWFNCPPLLKQWLMKFWRMVGLMVQQVTSLKIKNLCWRCLQVLKKKFIQSKVNISFR